MEQDQKYDYECARDVRISRLEEAFEQSQLRLRQLQKLPELSAILSQSVQDVEGKTSYCTAPCNKASCHPDDTCVAPDKTTVDDIKMEETKRTKEPPIRIAKVESLAIPKHPDIGFSLRSRAAVPLQSASMVLSPWYYIPYYQQYYRYSAIPQLSPYVYSRPSQGSQAYRDSPCQITRGQVWFPPDTTEQLQGIAVSRQSHYNWPPLEAARPENWTKCRYYTECGTGVCFPIERSPACEAHPQPHVQRSEVSKAVRIAI
jgi:hypothetical protein